MDQADASSIQGSNMIEFGIAVAIIVTIQATNIKRCLLIKVCLPVAVVVTSVCTVPVGELDGAAVVDPEGESVKGENRVATNMKIRCSQAYTRNSFSLGRKYQP